ncbi:cholinesterase 1-like [Patiria miniata]|uniref:Carboxylic ester hydrolase n=1 Tax=Patiria miniata TaxID=46514 RepID=A0A914BL38_PATMI|nr:cholinesterase 1-like [Patiria miniata]
MWLFLVVMFSLPLSLTASPSVETSQGRIVGKTVEFAADSLGLRSSVDVYLGIPYAEPPVGPLRFSAPVAKSPWGGELQATAYGGVCHQPPDEALPVPKPDVPQSEDCLYLNVYVPSRSNTGELSAVMVFIHGGAFIFGATWPDNIPAALASIGDVIVVDIQYRLGALGFLSTGDGELPGNMALLDQLEAIRWVQRHIKAFGGDPDHVTIFGQSAGSSSVSFHLLSPMSQGLFKNAIMQSGTANTVWSHVSRTEARRRAFALGHILGCDTPEDDSKALAQCLRGVSVQDIIASQSEKLFGYLGEPPQIGFASVIDDRFLLDDPASLLKKGALNEANIMIGHTKDEGMLMMSAVFQGSLDEAPHVGKGLYEQLLPMTIVGLGSMDPILLQAVKLVYVNDSGSELPDTQYLYSLSDAVGDSGFTCPTDQFARAAVEAGRTVYRFHFTHQPSDSSFFARKWTGACHADDLIYVFGLPFLPPRQETASEEERLFSAAVIKYWSNFAKTGNPNLGPDEDTTGRNLQSDEEWPRFTLPELAHRELSLRMRNSGALRVRECQFWSEFAPELVRVAGEAAMYRSGSAREGKWTASKAEEETCTKESCP